jgi:hypothetical protein
LLVTSAPLSQSAAAVNHSAKLCGSENVPRQGPGASYPQAAKNRFTHAHVALIALMSCSVELPILSYAGGEKAAEIPVGTPLYASVKLAENARGGGT